MLHRTGKTLTVLLGVIGFMSLVACSSAEPEKPSKDAMAAALYAHIPSYLDLENFTLVKEEAPLEDNVRRYRLHLTLRFNENFGEKVRELPAGIILKPTHSVADSLHKQVTIAGRRNTGGWDLRLEPITWGDVKGLPASNFEGTNIVFEGTPEAEALSAGYEADLAAERKEREEKRKAVLLAKRRDEQKRVRLIASQAVKAEPVVAPKPSKITGDDIARNMYERPEGIAVSRKLSMVLTDKRGKSRKRSATVYRRTVEGKKETRIRFEKPRSVRGMSFLTHDYKQVDVTDEQWLYLPAMKKVRRIPSSDRGDYFLGTDFTYNDVKDELKFEPSDYKFIYLETIEKDGERFHRISGKPTSQKVSEELGYGGVEALVSVKSWMPVDITFTDHKGDPLKRVLVSEVALIDDIWTAQKLVATNLQTGHTTTFRYSDIDYQDQLDSQLFAVRSLKR